MEDAPLSEALERLMREDGGRLLSGLIGYLRDFQLAEDSLQDALESALKHWKRNGLPNSPGGWLTQTARRKAIDRLRRAKNFRAKQDEYANLLALEQEPPDAENSEAFPDERLELIFTCCHPAIEERTRVALTLRTLGGLTTGEIARAFLVSEDAMAQRLVRVRHKISKAGIPYKIPDPEELPARLDAVLTVLYLIFNEGYAASGEAYIRADLCQEAIRLTRILNTLCRDEAEVEGLLALMILHNARRAARLGPDLDLVSLEDQDRARWDRTAIVEGVSLVETALQRGTPGPYQLQAAISAIHSEAISTATTGWEEIILLYDQLKELKPNPIVELNQIVAISYAHGPERAMTMLDPLEQKLENYQPYHATRADILRRHGDLAGAAGSYDIAISLTQNTSEKLFLEQRKNLLFKSELK